MSDARGQILGGIRRALRRDAVSAEDARPLETRLQNPPRGHIPGRTRALDQRGLTDLFETYAGAVGATVARIKTLDAVPEAVANFLAQHNLPAEIAMAPDPLLERAPWAQRPLLKIRKGPSDGRDAVSVSAAFAGIAETGTLMLASGPGSPTTLNFLPETHIVVVPAGRLVGPMEEAWSRLRSAHGDGKMPRTVNFITGPSRTADIEQTILTGAHGPRRLHVVIVEDDSLDA